MSEAGLIIPGVVQVSASTSGTGAGAVIQLGSAVGWTMSRGVHTWSRELSVVVKSDLTAGLRKELGLVLPEEQGDPDVVPRARKAAQACRIVAVEQPLLDQLIAKGLRVHTVGFDRVSNGFFYISQGGGKPARRVQGELIEMIATGEQPGADQLEARLDGLIDRLVADLSEGVLSEPELELAEALPPLGRATSEAAAKLQTLEGWLILTSTRASKYEADAKRLVDGVKGAARRNADVVELPIFGEARRVAQPELEVEFVEGDAGARRRAKLPARTRWLVTGRMPSASVPPPAVAPKAEPAAASRAARQPVAAEAASSPASAARPAAAGAAAARPAAEAAVALRSDSDAQAGRLAAEKAAQEKAAAERAAAEKAAAEKAAAERAAQARAAERAAAEKAAAERAAAERAAAERAAVERAAAERVAAERAAAERAAAEKAATAKAAAEKAAAEKAAAEKAAAQKAAAEKAAAEKAAAEKARPAAVARSVPPPAEELEAARTTGMKKTRARRLTFGIILMWLLLGAAVGALVKFLEH